MAPFWLLAAWAAGILLAESWPFPGGHPANVLIATGLLCAWVGLYRRRLAWLPLLSGMLLCAILVTAADLRPSPAANQVLRFADDEITTIEARIVALEPRLGGQRLATETLCLLKAQQGLDVRARLWVTLESGQVAAKIGQVIRFRGRLRQPHRFGMPGEFDYPRHLAAQGFHVTTFVKEAADIAVIPRHPATVSDFWANWRRTISEQIGAAVESDQAGLVRALTIGMRADVSPEQRRVLAAGGVAHLFAISGLHFGMFGGLLYALGSWAWRRSPRLTLLIPPQRLLPPLLLAPLAGYLLLTGSGWSTLRAFGMVALLTGLLLAGRRTPPLTLLATTALVLLILHPLALYAPGFQLSFAALAGIIAWLAPARPYLVNLPILLKWPAALVLTTAAASLATAPLIGWHFHHLAPAGLITNLVAVPLIAWLAVPLGLLGMAFSGCAAGFAGVCFQACAAIIGATLNGVAWLSSLPGLRVIDLPLQTGEGLFLAGLCTAALVSGHSRRAWSWRCAASLLAVLALWAEQPRSDQMRVIALSVGQGDATLLSFPGGQHMLVDGGGLPGTTFDPGERLVAPALARLGVRRLTGVLLTHDHPDHRDGLIYLLDHLPVDYFWSAIPPEKLPESLRAALDRHKIGSHQLPEGWTSLPTPAGFHLDLFVPRQDAPNLNERSVAVLAGSPDQQVLLTADLGPEGLTQLQQKTDEAAVSLLKLPHHGSRHSAPERFLTTYRPQLAFVSLGRNNPYHFPHAAAIEACRQSHTPLYRTDRHGMLTFTGAAHGWRAETFFAEEID